MPRVHRLTAAKDYPDIGVAKGGTYFKWKKRHGPTQRSATYPRPSQLSNAKYAVIEDEIESARRTIEGTDDAEEMKSALQSVADVAREVASEYEESHSNMESAFPSGCPKMEELEEKRDACESFADSCESHDIDTGELEAHDDSEPPADEERAKEHDAWAERRLELVQDLRDEAASVLDEFIIG